MKPIDLRGCALVSLALLFACEHEQPAKPAATTSASATQTQTSKPPPKPSPTPDAPPTIERIAREPSLTEVRREPTKPGVPPEVEIVPNPDGESVTVRDFHPTGWLYNERIEKFVEGGKRARHGPIKAWHENRQLMQIGNYADGKLQGHWTYWDDMGGREREGDYDQGLREGDWREWHPNGQPKSFGFFHVNLAEGPWKFWHDNGKLMAQGDFINNKREGQWLYWLEDGEPDVHQTGIYEDNHRVQ